MRVLALGSGHAASACCHCFLPELFVDAVCVVLSFDLLLVFMLVCIS